MNFENSREFPREFENSGIPGNSRSGIPGGPKWNLIVLFGFLHILDDDDNDDDDNDDGDDVGLLARWLRRHKTADALFELNVRFTVNYYMQCILFCACCSCSDLEGLPVNVSICYQI